MPAKDIDCTAFTLGGLAADLVIYIVVVSPYGPSIPALLAAIVAMAVAAIVLAVPLLWKRAKRCRSEQGQTGGPGARDAGGRSKRPRL